MTLKDCITKIEISSKSPFTERILKWAKQVTPTIVFKGKKKVYCDYNSARQIFIRTTKGNRKY